MVSDAVVGGTKTGSAGRAKRHRTARGALELGALGVVFGDIGTSPLYTVQTVFSPSDPHRVQVTTENVYGVISLIFWAVVTIVMVTYIILVMHADNDGEGGIMALITLIRRRSAPSKRRVALVLAALGVFGASLFFGDSMITPAISVLSAIEGVQVAAPSVGSIVLPLTAAILIGLFMLQRLGTGAVGRLFGPVMAIVMVTYVLLVMRADNDGEGGIMALITLIRRHSMPSRRRTALVLAALGIFGASLFFGDSMITPAISVLSAIEGVEVAAPGVGDIVLPVTAVILIGLFLIQRLGTGAVGRLFGPVMERHRHAIGR